MGASLRTADPLETDLRRGGSMQNRCFAAATFSIASTRDGAFSTMANADTPAFGGQSMAQQVSRLSRRNVLVAGGGTAAAVGFFVVSPLSNPITAKARDMLAGQSWARPFLSLSSGTLAEWQSVVGSSFAIAGGSSLRLAGVRALASPGERPYSVARRSGFLAVFEAEAGQSLASDLIYTLAHPQYGPLQIFLSSADPRQPRLMHAVFN